jgi:hypothetical protein
MKAFPLAVVAYVVPTFITGFVWHLVLLHDTYTQLAIYRPDPVIPMGLASMLVQGVVFAWAYPRLFSTARADWVRSAARAGLAFGALSWSFTTLAVSAKHPMASVPQYFAIETAFTLLQFALAAPLVALAWRGNELRA